MTAQAVTVELPEPLYHTLRRVAELTGRPMESVLQASVAHALPPLDDVSAEEAAELAALALLDDGELWREARAIMSSADQEVLHDLLDRQSEDSLAPAEQERLQTLLDAYGRITLRKAHAYLLLARRGYRVPMQT